MTRGILTFALLASLAMPAFAKTYALPAKIPAVTLTLPDDWDVTEQENEIVTVAADGYLVFNIAYGDRSDAATLIEESKAYLKKGKVNLAVKPVELAMDFSGVPARVLRYNTTGRSGKTIVDLVTLDASRDRVVLITIWGSKDEREGNEAALSAIIKSIKVPAESGSGTSNFWTGGTAPAAKPDAPKSAAGEPPDAAIPKVAAPLAVRKNAFVTRRVERFGVFTPRASDTFRQDEKVITYLETTGATLAPVEGGKVAFGYVFDYDIRNREGAILGGQKSILDRDFILDASDLDNGNPRFFFDHSLDISEVPPGAYVMAFTIRDKLSGRIVVAESPFSVTAAPALRPVAEAAPAVVPQDNAACAPQTLRTGLTTALNGADDDKDGKRRLRDLADAETVLDDKVGKRLSCRYTAVFIETGDGAPTERRMKLTFTLADDGKGGTDIDYVFDK